MDNDFVEMLVALSVEKARYLVVGAHALAVHGVVRATGDLDIFVEPSKANAKRVFRALIRFGAPLSKLTEADLSKPDIVFQMGNPPFRIDVLTGISGVGFGDAWRDRVVHSVGKLKVPFLGRAALLRNKGATGRAKDAVDRVLLLETRPSAKPPKKRKP